MGYDPAEIASIMSLPVASVQYHIDAAITLAADPDRVAAVREAEMAKLEALEEAFFPVAIGGDVVDDDGNVAGPNDSAARTILAIMERRSKITGADKPVEHRVTHSLVHILADMAKAPKVIEGDFTDA